MAGDTIAVPTGPNAKDVTTVFMSPMDLKTPPSAVIVVKILGFRYGMRIYMGKAWHKDIKQKQWQFHILVRDFYECFFLNRSKIK